MSHSGVDPLADEQARLAADEAASQRLSLLLHAEQASVEKIAVRSLVRARTETTVRDAQVDEPLAREDVVVERVAVGRYVDAVPPVRTEGDVTIMPVVEEEVVVTRRLLLREEVHLRRIRAEERHVETIALREQHVVVTREAMQPLAAASVTGMEPSYSRNEIRGTSMSDETIVAVYDTAAHADAAVADLRTANVPESAISRHSGTTATAGQAAPPVREQGFWASLFGGETDSYDTSTYDRSMDSGSSVVIVKSVPGHDLDAVVAILERHHPIDIDERASGYGMTSGAASTATTTGLATGATAGLAGATAARTGLATGAGDTVQLSEESLAVGKRVVNRGGTRIRRYVVETPVEESVTLHTEKVTLDRRPVTDGRPVGDASFSDKTIEMTETSEEAVVSKTARVVEEVSLRKDATERTETVRDTVRKEEVEIEQIPGSATTTGTTTTTTGGTVGGMTPKPRI